MNTSKEILTREEFLEKAGLTGFSLGLLDTNIANIQQKLQQQVSLWKDGQTYSITEHWVSRNPRMSISKVSICCSKDSSTQTTDCCNILIRVTDKHLKYIAQRTVWFGTYNELKQMLDSDELLICCKKELLWWNYAIEHSKEKKDMLAAGWKCSGDVLPDFMDYVNEQLSRLIIEWDEVVPEHGSFQPVFDIFSNPDEGSQNEVGAYGLKLFKMPSDIEPDEDKRFLEAIIYDPNRTYKISMVVISGNSTEIKVALSTTEFAQKVYDAYAHLLDLWE